MAHCPFYKNVRPNLSGIWLGTLHSIAYDMLRQFDVKSERIIMLDEAASTFRLLRQSSGDIIVQTSASTNGEKGGNLVLESGSSLSNTPANDVLLRSGDATTESGSLSIFSGSSGSAYSGSISLASVHGAYSGDANFISKTTSTTQHRGHARRRLHRARASSGISYHLDTESSMKPRAGISSSRERRRSSGVCLAVKAATSQSPEKADRHRWGSR